jgi:hypothetical protein
LYPARTTAAARRRRRHPCCFQNSTIFAFLEVLHFFLPAGEKKGIAGKGEYGVTHFFLCSRSGTNKNG